MVRRGVVAHRSSLGSMDRERGRPVADDTIWRWYSMTKPITGVALLSLYEQGRFRLDDPVQRYIPAFAATTCRAGRIWLPSPCPEATARWASTAWVSGSRWP